MHVLLKPCFHGRTVTAGLPAGNPPVVGSELELVPKSWDSVVQEMSVKHFVFGGIASLTAEVGRYMQL